jgi:hypothetical protein
VSKLFVWLEWCELSTLCGVVGDGLLRLDVGVFVADGTGCVDGALRLDTFDGRFV